MTGKNNNNKRIRNKGFTLTEVIVAVAILAISATPLISNFVTSAKMNQKAKFQLGATNLAQDIMEGMSVYKGEKVINMFESVDSLSGTVLPADMKYEEHGDLKAAGLAAANKGYRVGVQSDGSTQELSTDRQYSIKQNGERSIKADVSMSDVTDSVGNVLYHEGVRYFYIQGIKVNDDGAGNAKREYDAVIEMDYKDTTDTNTALMYGVNDKIDAAYENINKYDAAINHFHQPDS